MKLKLGPLTIRTGKDMKQAGDQREPLAQLTDEQIAQIKRFSRERETKESSKAGRELWWSRVGFLGLPLALLESAWIWLRGDEVWYSETGVRHVTQWTRHD